ncbi:polysaccharide pyruvyl transferase family protein [Oricola sp.]|uniref:polysaccharide pyruvyl transferase family protein n=1 Tax=Oricola sp. TaxID=1979950 RepID=UPI003559560C
MNFLTVSAQQFIEQTLRGIAVALPYAIVDYPNYANPGDAAIWSGARTALETVTGCPPAYVSTLRYFDARRCRDLVSGGTIFFLGGGNFGSLYEKHHRARLRVMREIADQKIVLLPLSVAESSNHPPGPAQVEDTRRTLGECADLQVLSREQKSRRLLREIYGVESILCPDTAHFFTTPAVTPAIDAVRLYRRDTEASRNANFSDLPQQTTFDWSDDKSLIRTNRIGKLSNLLLSHRLRLIAFDHVARKKAEIASRILGRGRYIYTDRLHGVILGTVMERYVIASDNTTGKVGSYVRTWSEQLPDVSLVDTGL